MQEGTDYAKQQSEILRNELQFLIDKQNEEKKNAQQLVTQNYENMINQLNQGRVPIEQQYQENARQAYVNKMLAGKQLEGDLTRLGLDTTGFALTQKIYNENQYSANLNQLALDRAAGLRGIDDDITNARGQLAADLLQVNSDYDARMNQLNQYISERVEEKYADEYARFMQNRQYEDQLKQQEIENQQKWASMNNSYVTNNNFGGSGGGATNLNGNSSGGNVGVDGHGNSKETFNKSDYYFKDSMQPRYVDNEKLSTSGIFGKDIANFLSKHAGVSLSEIGSSDKANVWTTPSGRYLIWDNNNKKYRDLTDVMRAFKNSSSYKENKESSGDIGITPIPNYSTPIPNYSTPIPQTTRVNDYVKASLAGTTDQFLASNRNKMYTGKK